MPRLLHLSDSHLVGGAAEAEPPECFSDGVRAITGRSTDELSKVVIGAALTRSVDDGVPVDLIVHTGDVTDHGDETSYGAAAAMLAATGLRYLVSPGNHDDPALVHALLHQPDSAVHHVDVGRWRIIAASSHRPGKPDGTYTDATLTALDASLSRAAADGRHVVVASHHPIIGSCAHPTCSHLSRKEFLSLVDQHSVVRAVITGHLHVAEEHQRHDVWFLGAPSTAMQLVHVHPLHENNHDLTPAGARLIDLHHDGTVSSELVWVDPTAEYQPVID